MDDWFDAERSVERAFECFDAGRFEEAEALLREALSAHPDRSDWHFNLGLTLDAVGRWRDAAQSFARAHTLAPDDAPSAMMTGVAYLHGDEPRESLPWLEKACVLAPDDPSPLVHRIEAHRRLGEHEQAELMFYLVQQIDPRRADAYAALADSLLDRGMHDKAVWCLREAAQLDSQIPGIHARLARAQAATGRLERARQLFLRELRQNPGDVETLLDLGDLLIEMGRPAEAGEKYRRVLELEPGNPEAHERLGLLAERMGNLDEAMEQYDVVLRLSAEAHASRYRLAGLLLRRGRPADVEQARRHLAEAFDAVREEPSRFSPEELEPLGTLLLDAGLHAQAEQVFARLVLHRPGSAGWLHLLSVAQFEQQNRSAGMDNCRKVLRLEPKFVPAMHNMAMACVQEGQWRRARYWVRQALLCDPDDVSLKRLRLTLRLHAVAEALSAVAEVAREQIPGLRRRRPAAAG